MSSATPTTHELTLSRIISAPRDKVWRCWTEPALLMQWYCPRPWRVTQAELDVRPGGRSYVLMEGPNGEQAPHPGVYLEVIPGRKLVMTDAFDEAWLPSGKAFMVAEINLDDAGGGRTHYRAVARHWSEEDRQTHEQMGFHEGWAAAAQQLEDLARTI